jgi:hypothetical protein
MSLIGKVFNRDLRKDIPLYIAEYGDGYKRLVGAISQDAKDAALQKIKERFESGALFKDDDMKQMEQLVIT